MADSIYYYNPGGFKQYFRTITDQLLLVSDALAGFREVKCLPKKVRELTVQQVSDDPKLIAEIHQALRDGMEPESKYKLPYGKEERQKEIVDSIAEAYKWKTRYENNGVGGLHDLSKVSRTIKYKVDTATEETILDLRLKRFGCNRISFRLKRLGVYLSSRTIYKILKRHCLNILECKIKNRKYRRFAMKHPNDMVQMDILGPFYIRQSSARNYIISCIDDCSRKVASKWSERKKSIDVLDVLEEWI